MLRTTKKKTSRLSKAHWTQDCITPDVFYVAIVVAGACLYVCRAKLCTTSQVSSVVFGGMPHTRVTSVSLTAAAWTCCSCDVLLLLLVCYAAAASLADCCCCSDMLMLVVSPDDFDACRQQ